MRRHILCLRPPRCALQMCKPMGDADSERPNARHAISSDRALKGTMAWAEAQQVHCCLFGTLSCGRKQQALAQHATSKSSGPMHASSKSTQPESKPVAKGVEGISFQGSKGGAH